MLPIYLQTRALVVVYVGGYRYQSIYRREQCLLFTDEDIDIDRFADDGSVINSLKDECNVILFFIYLQARSLSLFYLWTRIVLSTNVQTG